jgi:Tol biopolymer transport system component
MYNIIGGDSGNAAPQLSPDGRRIAFMSDRSGTWQIWVGDANGSNAVQVSHTDSAGTPRWSPDSRFLAFDAPSDDGTSIFVTAVDETQRARRLVRGLVPSFSRDGKWVYFASDQTGDWQVWKVPVNGGLEEQVTRNGGFAALESPDGYVYFSKSRDNPVVCRVSVRGGDEQCLSPDLRPRTWSSWAVTRKGILFVEDASNGDSVLSLYQPARHELSNLVKLETAPHWVGASSDGTKVVMNDSSERQISMIENLR